MTPIPRHSQIHFYKDGDIELLVEKIIFRVHKNILTLSSQFFNGMYQSATPSIEDLTAISNTGFSIPRVELRGDAAPDVEKLLSFLYPNTYFEISWGDVANLLRLADKYIVETLTTACVAFLKRSYQEEPLQALKLAEAYQISSVYKESSKLVLDDFEKFFYEPRNLEGLSRSTQKKLKVQRQQYVEGLNKLYCVTVDRRFPPLTAEHLRTKFEECVKDICTFPFHSPSYSWMKLHQVDCSKHFECREELRRLKPFIHEKIVSFFGGEYELLAWTIKAPNFDAATELSYPFIELRDD
ncbi:32943_t:CDS:1 [Gigaspora margarita]|uniref:BTB/POZ domain-containing protein n=2 Tax=Gigaspora margarita TaxID=4874 RepID=A0A8H3XDZ6_GIGMA|nr:BTB/POZ domain-containing protein [Gigaspora margarita]CAG8518351.1 32943_t:CDS:1 [Gigaspora margarita]